MIQGQLDPDFWPVARVFEQQVRRSGGGAALCIYHRGIPVVDIWAGYQDEQNTPWQEDALSFSFSTTKGVTATALHLLVDRGLADYEDTIAQYWPEFAQAGKAEITIRQLLCHEAGLYGLRTRIDHIDRMLDWNYMVDVLAAAEPVHSPGEANGYHAFTFGWLVGELIQRISGRPFSEIIQKELADPLGLDGLYIGLPESELGRAARLLPMRKFNGSDPDRLLERIKGLFSFLRLPVDPLRSVEALGPRGISDFDWNHPEVLKAAIPAANGMFTARSFGETLRHTCQRWRA